MDQPDTAPVASSPDVLTRTIVLTSSDEAGIQWEARADGVSRMEIPTILRLVANLTEKALTGGGR